MWCGERKADRAGIGAVIMWDWLGEGNDDGGSCIWWKGGKD